ncbi:35751_t:CDS:2, partial [Racocetra persica]
MSSPSQIPSNNSLSSFHPNSYLDITLTDSPPKTILVKLSLNYPPLPHNNIDDNQDYQSQASSSLYIKFRFFQTDSKDDIKQEIAKAFNVEEFSLIDENDNIITASWFSLEDNQKYQIIDRSCICKSFDDLTSEKHLLVLNKGKKSVIYERKHDHDPYRNHKKASANLWK